MAEKETRELPEKLNVTDGYEIQEALSKLGMMRILLHPAKCYLNDDVIQLESIIETIVDRYNQHEALLAYQGYVNFCITQNRVPMMFEEFKKDLSLAI